MWHWYREINFLMNNEFYRKFFFFDNFLSDAKKHWWWRWWWWWSLPSGYWNIHLVHLLNVAKTKKRRKKQCFNWNNKNTIYWWCLLVWNYRTNNWLTCFDSIQSLKYCRLVRRFLTLMNLFFFLFLLETIKRSFLSFRIHSFCLFVVGLNGLTNIEKKVGACFFSFHFCLDKMFFSTCFNWYYSVFFIFVIRSENCPFSFFFFVLLLLLFNITR